MKKIFISILVLFFSVSAKSQLMKGNWLVGGSGNFASSKNTYSNINFNQTSDVIDIKISPNIGYFLVNSFALGLRPSFIKNKAKVTSPGGLYTNVTRFEIGPYARYYFLNEKKQFNLLADVAYQFGIYRFKPDKGNIKTFSAFVGPVIYFNSVVGLEFLLGYYNRREVVSSSYETEQKSFQISIGFQIHLEKKE
jgi:hypothetical protein